MSLVPHATELLAHILHPDRVPAAPAGAEPIEVELAALGQAAGGGA